jgi:hypothetical protein
MKMGIFLSGFKWGCSPTTLPAFFLPSELVAPPSGAVEDAIFVMLMDEVLVAKIAFG